MDFEEHFNKDFDFEKHFVKCYKFKNGWEVDMYKRNGEVAFLCAADDQPQVHERFKKKFGRYPTQGEMLKAVATWDEVKELTSI